MRTTPLAGAALALALALAGCAGTPAPKPHDEGPAMACDAAKAQWAVGRPYTPELLARAKADTGADRTRTIEPGMMVTMDYVDTRLNIDLDEQGRVKSVRCG